MSGSSDSKMTACDFLDAMQSEMEEQESQQQGGFAYPVNSFDFGSINSNNNSAEFFSFPGDPYAASDDEVTRGADPVSFLPSGPGLETPFWHSFGDVLSGGEQLFREDAGVFGGVVEKKRAQLSWGEEITLDVESQKMMSNSKNQVSLPLAKTSFDTKSSALPLVLPSSSNFALRNTSIFAACEHPAELGNQLLHLLSRGEAFTLLELKVKPAKFTIKATIVNTQSLKEITLKVRIYALPVKQREWNDARDDFNLACEFQRQAGDGFEFLALYEKIADALQEVFHSSTSLSSSPMAQAAVSAAEADTRAAQALMTLAVLPPLEDDDEETTQEETKNAALESFLHQASSSSANPGSQAEAALGLALLARQMQNDEEELAALLMRLMEEHEEKGGSGFLAPLRALLKSETGQGAASYGVACLVEAIFRSPKCSQLLWESPEAAKPIFAAISGPLAAAEKQAPEACLEKLSHTVRMMCAALPEVFPVDQGLASEVQEQLRRCVESPCYHSCGSLVREDLEVAMSQIPLVC